ITGKGRRIQIGYLKKTLQKKIIHAFKAINNTDITMKRISNFRYKIQTLKKYTYVPLALLLFATGCKQQENKTEQTESNTKGFKGKIGRTLAETQQAWPDYKSK